MRRIPVLTVCFLLILVPAVMGQAPNATGTWDATLTSPQGTFNITLTLQQDGEKVTGKVKGARGELPVEGSLKGKDIKLEYTTKFQENDLHITLTGVLEGANIKGAADYGGLAQGEFNAKRAGDAAAPAAASTTPAIDVTGTWAFQVETSQGSGTPTFTFKQEGEKLTGQYKGAFGEAPVTGTVKANKIDFQIKINVQGQQATINYTGTIEKDGTMKGTAELGELGQATWTAKRQ